MPDYFTVIEDPITVLSLLEALEAAPVDSDAEVVDSFTLSIRRMWENCWSYNHEGTKVPNIQVCVCVCSFPIHSHVFLGSSTVYTFCPICIFM